MSGFHCARHGSMEEASLLKVLVTIIVAWYSNNVFTSAETYYVTPSSNTPCPEEGVPCFTLSQYANKSSNYFASNTTLILLLGDHSLDLEFFFQNIKILSIESTDSTSHSDSHTSITCYESARFTFESISVVSMRGLTLLGCMNNNITRVEEFTVEDCSFDGQGCIGTGVSLVEVSTANIKRSFFSSNTGTEITSIEPDLDDELQIQAGGAIVFINTTLGIIISDCVFQNNVLTGYSYARGGAVYVDSAPYIIILNSALNNNTLNEKLSDITDFEVGGGALFIRSSSNVTIFNSTLNCNNLTGDVSGGLYGAALHVRDTLSITVFSSSINGNIVTGSDTNGGVLYATGSNVTIVNSTLNSNTLTDGIVAKGGAVYASSTNIMIMYSTLNNNTVTASLDALGGAVYADSNALIVNSTFNGNTADAWVGDGAGGAMYITGKSDDISTLHIVNSTFNSNKAIDGGAVFIYSYDYGYHQKAIVAYSSNSTFSNNICTDRGSVFYLLSATFKSSGFLNFQNNIANSEGVLYAIQSTLYFSGNTTVANNHGSLFVYSCNVTFVGYTNIVNNLYEASNRSKEGGALTAFQSEIVLNGRVNLRYNRAIQGGAIAATQSKVYVYGNVAISHNTASMSGGGIYAYQSELNFKNHINISRNNATIKGGGIHATSSTIRLTSESQTNITGNHAERGGGLCLEGSAKFYILKIQMETIATDNWTSLRLDSNTADYGGAVYVSDNTTSATCLATPSSDNPITTDECFIQGISLYRIDPYSEEIDFLVIVNTYFVNNSAKLAGDVLYGGLLDRCKVSPFAEIFYKDEDLTPSSLSGASYLLNITDLTEQDFGFNSTKVSSDSVRVCFCTEEKQPDCSYHPQLKYVRKGEMFPVSLVAVDHINNSIANSTIHASVRLNGKLGEGQSSQQTSIDGSCTNLTYSILSPHDSEELHLYADGPCMNDGISTTSLTIIIEPCPIGFQNNDLHEHCECTAELYPEYISNCSIDTATVQRKGKAWFSYANTTDHHGYVLHKYCPFDYCKPLTKNVSVDLNIENGADKLCAFNRSRKLCGSCEDGLSLSLGSSRCRQCSNNWLALLIVFALAGVALVAFILKLNITVAEGTLNGLIFYANIFLANRAVLFPHDKTNILTVFIAWLNLDFGFEACFYDGMDSYAKTWLQFAFPLYVISLVAAIIIIGENSTKFARLFTAGKKSNPIATLATLILLSYTKLLRTIIDSLSVAKLEYSDGSSELVWLVDANIPYLSPKHIPLFITALIIAMVGTAFTIILFAWQWLVYCSDKINVHFTEWKYRRQRDTLIMEYREEKETVSCLQSLTCTNIIGNTKFISIMDAYHNPYNKDFRYWIGLQLIVRIVLYLVSALNVSGDPRINLVSIITVIVTIHFFKQIVESKRKVNGMGIENNLRLSSMSELPLSKMVTTLLIRKVHKHQLVEVLEAISLLNLALLTSATLLTEDKESQNIVAYISTSIAFITFLALLGYHAYKFTLSELFHKIRAKFHTERGRPTVTLLSTKNTVSATKHNTEESGAEYVFEVDASPENLLTKSLVEDDDSNETHNEIEVPNLVSEHRSSLTFPSMLGGTSSQDDDGSSESEDEYTPLITRNRW